MSKYSRNTGYYDHSNNRWVDGRYYSSESAGLTLKEWLLFAGIVFGTLAVLIGVIEVGAWILTGHSFIVPPKH